MYHELGLLGRSLCQSDPGYTRYVLDASNFEAQMKFLKHDGWKALSVGQALKFPAGPSVAITFDDGCETDLLVAAPILLALGFNATFYITCAFLETKGYLSKVQLKELSGLGVEIGSHSMTHAYLTDLDDDALHREIAESKTYLEQLLGKQIEHFSCPGGRYDHRVDENAKAAGYRTVATSRIHSNSAATDPYGLGRVAVMRGTTSDEFAGLCKGRGFWKMNLRNNLQQSAKHLLGNAVYDRARAAILK